MTAPISHCNAQRIAAFCVAKALRKQARKQYDCLNSADYIGDNSSGESAGHENFCVCHNARSAHDDIPSIGAGLSRRSKRLVDVVR